MIPDLHHFQPVDLAELDVTAALRTRKDRKYLVPLGRLDRIVEGFDPGAVRVLEIEGRRDFGYESIYFDTPDLACFRATAYRRRRRFKVRTRRYTDRGDTFLEAKVRHRKRLTVKHRLPIADHGRLRPGGRDFLRSIDGVGSAADDLRPVLTTAYRRATVLAAAETARLTIDVGLAWRLPAGPAIQLSGVAVVETKSIGPPTSLDRLLWALGHRPTRISKYATGLAAFDHDLPANTWHRVLRDHFGREGDHGAIGRCVPRRIPALAECGR
ncbi:MAG: polyphosphate polymerase domain-containing protein [Acidimicrobiia bacterium]|nr:polyphosphate polymerase domain-containing protein [Acidimicrobiia bacterium]